MREHLTTGLPGPLRRMLLLWADQCPKLQGRLGFHAQEGEAFGPGGCSRVGEDGVREQRW